MKKNKDMVFVFAGVVIVIILLFPFYWMFVSSIKPPQEIITRPPLLIPRNPTLESYSLAFTEFSMGRYLQNSFIIASFTTVITIILGTLAAYGLARFRIKGVTFLISILLISQLLPDVSLLLPLFITFKRFGLLNTYISVILANVMLWLPFAILILRPYFLMFPKALEDAARIDGCTFLGAFRRVVLPLALPAIMVSAILTFLFSWGEFVFALTFLTKAELRPITIGIYNAIGQYGIKYNDLMAYSVIAILPAIIIFISFQKYIRSGLVIGGVKG
jgi:multiple sugar transport system permease protein